MLFNTLKDDGIKYIQTWIYIYIYKHEHINQSYIKTNIISIQLYGVHSPLELIESNSSPRGKRFTCL
jgi:hypothetical protein